MNDKQNNANAQTWQLPLAGVIGCLPIRVNFDFCFECKKVTPYSNGYCWYCHSAAPLGDPHDEQISDEEWEQYFKESVIVGNISQVDENTLYFLNSL